MSDIESEEYEIMDIPLNNDSKILDNASTESTESTESI
jgi:hypothetical protein